MAFAETQQLTVELNLKGNLNAKLGEAARAIKGFDKATSNTQRSLSQFGRNIERGVVLGATAVAGGLGLVVKAASDYESAFAGVRKTVNATEPELAELSKQFRALSKEIPISASELARLGEAGGALGVPTAQLEEFVRVTALLGVTTNLTADEAADSLGVLGNVLHLTGEEYSKFASSLVALGNAGASTERDIVSIAERAGAAGALIGVSTEQILGFSSAVASLGIESEAGGTAIQKFFIDTAKFTAQGGDELKILAKVAGETGKSFQKAFKDDAGGALQDFLEGLGKLPQAKQLKVLEDLGFNDARITRTLLGLANNTKLVGDQMNVANKAFEENTALTKEADQRFKTFASQVTILKNTLTDMAISIGEKLLPKITPLIKRLNDFINLPTSQAKIGEFADKLASGVEKVANAIGKVDWQPFIDGLRLSAEIAKTAINAFRSLPTELQGLIVGGFALNKLTGGLGTSIAKDLGGALLNQFAARGSSPANPLFVTDISKGLGGAGAAGIGGKLLNVATKVFVVGLAAEAASQIAGPIQDFGRNVHTAIFGEGGDPFSDFGKAWEDWRRNADWPFGQRNAPEWLGGSPATPAAQQVGGAATGIGKLVAPMVAAERDIAEFVDSRQRTERDIAEFVGSVDTRFRDMIAALKDSKGTKAVAKAVADAIALVVGKGRGSVDNTRDVLAALRKQLGNTHDPKLQAALRSAIAKVQAKIVGREFVQKQLHKADQIFRSTRTTAEKIRELKQIEQSLGGKSLNAQRQVQAKIDAARRAQVAAAHGTTQAVKNKDLSVTVNVPRPSVSIRQVINGTRVLNQYTSIS